MPRRPRQPRRPVTPAALARAVVEALEPRRLLAAVYAVDFGFDAHPQRVDYVPLVPPPPPGTRGVFVPPRRPPLGGVFPNGGDPYVLTNLTIDAPVDRATLALGPGAAAGSFALTAPGLPGGVFADGNYELLLPVEEGFDGSDFHRIVEEPHGFFQLAGDVNRDRVVDLADWNVYQSHYGMASGATYADGDATGDGAVDSADSLIFYYNYGLRLPPPPTASNSVTAAAHPDFTASVQWTPPGDGSTPDGYRVYRSTDGANFERVAEVPDPAARAWTDAGPLAQGKRYWYRVRPYTAAAGSALTTNKFWAVTPLPAPTGFAATAASPTEASLSWSDAGDGTAGFAVQIESANGFWGTPVPPPPTYPDGTPTPEGTRIISTGRTTASVTGLTPGTAYRFRAVAKTPDAQSAPTNPAGVTTPVAAPQSFAATSAGPASVALTWQYPAGAGVIGGFRATLHPIDGGDDVVATFAAGATGGTVEGLAPNTEYAPTLAALPPEGSASEETPAAETPVVRTDPLLTTVQSPYTQEGAGFAIQLDAHGYAVRKWLLDWGDEILQVVAPADDSPTTVARHAYADDGTYEVKASVADERGTFAAGPVSLEVRDAAAAVSAAALVPGAAMVPGTAFTIKLTHADPGALDVPTYSIDWGDGTTTGADPNGITASHVYAAMDRYTIAVTATDPKGVASAAPPLVVGDDVSAPTGLRVTATGPDGVSLAWADATGGRTGTTIEYKLAADTRDLWTHAGTFDAGVTSGGVTVRVAHAEEAEGTFTFRARAASGYATGHSNPVTQRLAGPAPTLPGVGGLSATPEPAPGGYTASGNVAGIVIGAADPGGDPAQIAYEAELTDLAPDDPFLTEHQTVFGLRLSADPDHPGRLRGTMGARPGTPHRLRVRSWRYGDGGVRLFSPWSAPQSVTTAGTPRAAPSVTAAAVSPTSVRFTEEADKPPYEGYSYYSAQLHADQWFTASDGTDPATGASATLITGLAPGTAYRFAVRRKAPGWISGGAPDTAPAFVDVATPPAAVRPPQSPDSLVPSQRLGGEGGEGGYVIDLAWRDATTPLWSGGSSSDPPDDFVVERAEMVDGPYGPAYGPFAAVGTAGAATPFFTDAAALPEVEYAYRVRARNAGGLSVDRPENNAGARITLPRVGVFSDVPVAGERAGDPGQFVFERDGDLSQELPIKFDLVDLPAGHNAAPDDYDLSNDDDLKFAAGQRFAYLAVTATVDNKPEFPEALAAAVGASSAYEPADGQRPSTRATSGPAVVTIPDVPVDLDVDSDNDNGFEQPDRSAYEDSIEESSNRSGKVIAENDDDGDNDGVPDWADGYSLFEDKPQYAKTPGEHFIPIKLELSDEIDRSKVRLKINYHDSDPNQVTRLGSGTPESPYTYYLPPSNSSGVLRLWSKPGDLPRSGKPISEVGGTYIGATGDAFYDGGMLSALDWTGNTTTLWAEAIGPSDNLGDATISVSVDTDGQGPLTFTDSDVVRLTVVDVDLLLGASDADDYSLHDDWVAARDSITSRTHTILNFVRVNGPAGLTLPITVSSTAKAGGGSIEIVDPKNKSVGPVSGSLTLNSLGTDNGQFFVRGGGVSAKTEDIMVEAAYMGQTFGTETMTVVKFSAEEETHGFSPVPVNPVGVNNVSSQFDGNVFAVDVGGIGPQLTGTTYDQSNHSSDSAGGGLTPIINSSSKINPAVIEVTWGREITKTSGGAGSEVITSKSDPNSLTINPENKGFTKDVDDNLRVRDEAFPSEPSYYIDAKNTHVHYHMGHPTESVKPELAIQSNYAASVDATPMFDLSFRIALHFVNYIDPATGAVSSTTLSPADKDALVAEVNTVWSQAGIRFICTVNNTINTGNKDFFDVVDAPTIEESTYDDVLKLAQTTSIDIYVVNSIKIPGGWFSDPESAAGTTEYPGFNEGLIPGAVIATRYEDFVNGGFFFPPTRSKVARTISHELGHYLQKLGTDAHHVADWNLMSAGDVGYDSKRDLLDAQVNRIRGVKGLNPGKLDE